MRWTVKGFAQTIQFALIMSLTIEAAIEQPMAPRAMAACLLLKRAVRCGICFWIAVCSFRPWRMACRVSSNNNVQGEWCLSEIFDSMRHNIGHKAAIIDVLRAL
jgi:hypothetical protein